jgi:hypothetical protein
LDASILDVVDDVFSAWFRKPASWAAWFVFLAALFGLPMTEQQLATYRECTGRTEPPTEPIFEAWLAVGRRGGKSFVLALIAVFLACFRSYAEFLQPGEVATILIVARDRAQARTIFRYCRGLLQIPMLKALIESETNESFELSNSVVIEVATASYRSIRGRTVAALLADELAFWPTDDAAEPDYAVLDAVRPAMVTIPTAMMLCASSPYARRGSLWDAFRKHFGKDGPILFWKAPTRVMNPGVPQRVIDEAYERDPAWAAAEYGAEFRSDVDSFVSREAVEACVAIGCFERAPVHNSISYRAFCDPSGGSSDSMALSIAHRDGDRVVIDLVREVRPPFNPSDVVEQFSVTLKTNGISSLRADRYAGEWPAEQFRKFGINYEPSAKPKSELYQDLLPLINAGRVELLDHPKLIAQLCSLERRTARSGKDSIDHPPGQRDDLANSVAGACTELALTGADAWIAWAKGLAERAQRPLAVTHVRDIDPDNTVADAYNRVMRRALATKEKCTWCGEELGSSRTTDGEYAYHTDCYHEMLSKSTACS